MHNHERILLERRRAGVLQAPVAKALGITKQGYVDIERGRVTVDNAYADRVIAEIDRIAQGRSQEVAA